MVVGSVHKGAASVTLIVRGRQGGDLEIQAVIDTGFNSFLTLSPSDIAALGLPFEYSTDIEWGDGRRIAVNCFTARIDWHGRDLLIPVHESPVGALIGMRLLRDCRLTIEVSEGGIVTVEQMVPNGG